MRLRLIGILAQIMITEPIKINIGSVQLHSGNNKRANKKAKAKGSKHNNSYCSTKPIKSKATKVFRNKSNI